LKSDHWNNQSTKNLVNWQISGADEAGETVVRKAFPAICL